jgi:hypothetical protein
MLDELDQIRKLAGINEFKGYTAYEGSNISITGTEKAEIMRDQEIKPGTDDWFRLWFSRPYWKQIDYPAGFRGRK